MVPHWRHQGPTIQRTQLKVTFHERGCTPAIQTRMDWPPSSTWASAATPSASSTVGNRISAVARLRRRACTTYTKKHFLADVNDFVSHTTSAGCTSVSARVEGKSHSASSNHHLKKKGFSLRFSFLQFFSVLGMITRRQHKNTYFSQ